MTSGGTSPMARTRANSKNATLSASQSRTTRKCSPAKPDGPAAAPRRDLRRFCNNNSPSKTTWSSGLYSMSSRATGALGTGGRRDGSDNIVRVLSLPGATNAPFSACLPLESSPHCVNCNALFARLPITSPLFPRRRRREVAVLHDCASALLASTNNSHSPRANASQRSESFALDTTPPRGGSSATFVTSVNNFHARVSCSTLPAARASAASWKLRRNAVLTTPLMIFGTRIKQLLLLNSVSKVIWSKLLNPLAIEARATSIPIGTMSSRGGSNVPTTSASSGSEWPPVSPSPSSPPSLPAGVWMAWNSALSVSDSTGGRTTCGTPDVLGTPGSSLISAESGEKRFACRTTGVFTNVGVNRDGRAGDAADDGTVKGASSSEESMRVRSW